MRREPGDWAGITDPRALTSAPVLLYVLLIRVLLQATSKLNPDIRYRDAGAALGFGSEPREPARVRDVLLG